MHRNIELDKFRLEVMSLINSHRIVKANYYTSWFSQGNASLEELQDFTVQFSVFSHLFIEAQLRKCINALDLESYRAGKEILLNELGVTFTKNGSIEDGRFRFKTGHFEWLSDFAQHLNLGFDQIGKREVGNDSTLSCCDALLTYYGSSDPSIAAGASHAIEHWAAAGFWKELIQGLTKVKAKYLPNLPLGFWIWHDALEAQHATHTDDELAKIYSKDIFSQDDYLHGAQAMLDAIAIFWDGLESSRKKDHAA